MNFDFPNGFGAMSDSEPWLGISMSDADEGVEIVSVSASSPAANAGLETGDILLAIDDVTMNSAEDVVSHISQREVNDIISIEYLRDGKKAYAEAALRSKSSSWMSQIFPQWDGIESPQDLSRDYLFGDRDVFTWRTDDAPQLGATVQNHEEVGVEIVSVAAGSIAESAGLRQGDVIVKYGDRDISEVEELVQELQRQAWDETTRFEFLREGKLLVTEAIFEKKKEPRPKNLRKL